MPKIAELKVIDDAVWARIPMKVGSPVELLSPEEIETNRQREIRYLDKIESDAKVIAALREVVRIATEYFKFYAGSENNMLAEDALRLMDEAMSNNQRSWE